MTILEYMSLHPYVTVIIVVCVCATVASVVDSICSRNNHVNDNIIDLGVCDNKPF